MKHTFLVLLAFISLASAHASDRKLEQLKTSKEFLATCPAKYRTFIYVLEYGDIDYCDCPNEKINYIDRHEGGNGFYCEE